jgi:hypothetical protein
MGAEHCRGELNQFFKNNYSAAADAADRAKARVRTCPSAAVLSVHCALCGALECREPPGSQKLGPNPNDSSPDRSRFSGNA